MTLVPHPCVIRYTDTRYTAVNCIILLLKLQLIIHYFNIYTPRPRVLKMTMAVA